MAEEVFTNEMVQNCTINPYTGTGYTCYKCGAFVYSHQVHQCAYTTTGTYVWPSIRSWYTCEHCYCKTAAKDENRTGPHAQCCKCKQVMARKFLKKD